MKTIRVRIDSLIPQLGRVRLFRLLPESAIRRLVEYSDFVEYEPQETIIREHALEEDVYLILEGSCAVMVEQENGQAYVATLGAGQITGEAAIFSNMPRTATVIAQDRVRLMRFERTAFMLALKKDPVAGMKVLFSIVHNLMVKLREVNLELAFERRDAGDQSDVDAFIASVMDGK
ncbi:MAG: cyclic nucleotide-binding domain-containing protein [Spirochaetaceae bacterium]|nr:MAG: cyclic nucleotide-binding domain-containing protein [Spirochaetaceae bacterium]